MMRLIPVSLLSVLCAGLLAGCSNEVQPPHQREMCPTDGLAILGQDIYYGRFTSCISDGHSVPVDFPVNRQDTLSVSVSEHTGMSH